MNFVEKVGKTIEDAVTEACIELGASRDEVEVEVISKGSKGLLGFGAKEAKVRVSIKEKVKEEPIKLQVKFEKEVPKEVENTKKELPNKEVKKEVKKELKKDSEDFVVVTPEELEEVTGLAMSFLEKLLKEMSIDATMTSKVVNNNRISISISGNNMGIIIGKRGETLDAIQYIVNIVANKQRQEYIKIMIDTENYRERREETLRKLAYKLSKKVQQTRKPIILEPMNPYDRRIIHSALQDSRFVKTHSEGKEPFRRVVISPAYQNKSYR
ncbi:RNA-binding protein [Sporanaerobium hydrogeniformans]|uniref:RNA-binding protein n=1 Tax=Sporanaerobium hydrogeniformans TaxID=3072179 RepID=A0AC61DBE1_9FIRM|nr:RNA-binding cell elongation regulator Jag/EloR [Sporanaerobium hydrogeniformans]PHV70619.1 RNA-binding protein [Sporanaerobium hydrogeniformans]